MSKEENEAAVQAAVNEIESMEIKVRVKDDKVSLRLDGQKVDLAAFLRGSLIHNAVSGVVIANLSAKIRQMDEALTIMAGVVEVAAKKTKGDKSVEN